MDMSFAVPVPGKRIMSWTRRRGRFSLLATAIVLLSLTGLGIGRAKEASSSTYQEPLLVAAAASLQFAFSEIGQQFEAETGQPVIFTFGSSGSLAHQIENGAPADLYAAANASFAERLASKGYVNPSSRERYAQGQLVLAVSRAGGVQIESLTDLLSPAVLHIAIANPVHAPYGRAAREALESAGVWEALQPKLVYGENVRQAMQFVETGNAEAGLIALSVADTPAIRHTLLDHKLYRPLDQVIAIVHDAPREESARRFIAYLQDPPAQAIMEHYGFMSIQQIAEQP